MSVLFLFLLTQLNITIMNIDYKVGEVKLSYKPKFKNQQKVTCSEDAYKYLLSTYKKGTICYKEYFKVLFLNQANQILGYTLISEGGLTETTADVRLIFQAALLTNSVALILVHNHPSGFKTKSRGYKTDKTGKGSIKFYEDKNLRPYHPFRYRILQFCR